jgi:diguanylate cyclase (GGDEF)-like protein
MDAELRRKLIQRLALPVLYFVGVKLSLALAVAPDTMVMLWVPNSLLLAALLHFGMRGYTAFALLVVAAELAADYPVFTVAQAALFGAANLVEVTLAYLLLRRWQFDPRFGAPSDIAKFLLAAPGIGALAAAFLAAAVYTYGRGAQSGYLELVRVWWYSDSIGLLVLTPLILSFWPVSPRVEERVPLRWYDGAVAVAALLVLVAFALAERTMLFGIQVRPVLLFPFVVYAAARLNLRATTLVTAGYAAVILLVTRNGQQPFGEMTMAETVREVQQFVYLMTATSLALSTLLWQLRTNARELEMRVEGRTAELRAANAELQRLTVVDPLTGLLNRRALGNVLRREMDRSRRHRHDLAVIMFDLDHFKRVNDQHGHAAGDAVLRHVAAVATRSVRGTDAVARYGGEEFVIVGPETEWGEAMELAERVRAAVSSSPTAWEGRPLTVTASFGVAMLSAQDADADAVIQRADRALYAAKAAGRNRVVADASMVPDAAADEPGRHDADPRVRGEDASPG